MLNGRLKPGYNAQISTNNQIIITYSIHQNPTDTLTLEPHLESYKQELGSMPKELTADAGYGSEESYEFMEKNFMDAYVKYNYFDQEQQNGGQSKGPFHSDNLYYNKERNCYYCPMGQVMAFIGTKEDITESGYKRTLSRYQAQNYTNCPLRGKCHKAKGNRIIEVSLRLNELRAKA